MKKQKTLLKLKLIEKIIYLVVLPVLIAIAFVESEGGANFLAMFLVLFLPLVISYYFIFRSKDFAGCLFIYAVVLISSAGIISSGEMINMALQVLMITLVFAFLLYLVKKMIKWGRTKIKK